MLWNYWRNFKNYTGDIYDDHMVGKVKLNMYVCACIALGGKLAQTHTLTCATSVACVDLSLLGIPLRILYTRTSTHVQDVFAALQSAYANLRLSADPTTSVVVTGDCDVLKSFAAGSPYDTPAKRHFEAIYWNPGYAEQNGYRMGTYFQIIYLLARYPQAYGGGNLATGWSIVTLLYQAARQLDSWASGTDAYWESKRALLGMDLFPRVGGGAGVPYSASQDVRRMVGNDFLVSG